MVDYEALRSVYELIQRRAFRGVLKTSDCELIRSAQIDIQSRNLSFLL